MRLTRKSLALLAFAAILAFLDLAPIGADPQAQSLPTLSAVSREAVRRIELSRGLGEKLVMVGSIDEGWRITQPFEGEADPLLVRALLNLFREPIAMDLRVDQGNLETYALDDEQALVLQLFTDSDTPALALAIGGDMPGGISFVRLLGSEDVYRARVGGRKRLEQDFSEWRNRLVVSWDVDTLSDIEIARGTERLHFQRPVEDYETGRPKPGAWARLDDPSFPVDPEALQELAAGFANVRAGRLLPDDFDGGFNPPAAELTLTRADGERLVLLIGSRPSQDGAWMRVQGKAGVYAVAAAKRDLALRDLNMLRDRRIFNLDRAQFDTFTLRDGDVPVVLRQLDEVMWEVAEPKNVDADVKLILFAANTFASLRADGRAEGVALADVGLAQPSATLTARLKSGDEVTLRIGSRVVDEQGRGYFHVSPAGTEDVYLLRDQTVARMRQGFGRAE